MRADTKFIRFDSKISIKCKNIAEMRIYAALEELVQNNSLEHTIIISIDRFFQAEEEDEKGNVISPSINFNNFKNIITLEFIHQSISNIRSYGFEENFKIFYGFKDDKHEELIFSKDIQKTLEATYDTQTMSAQYQNTLSLPSSPKVILFPLLQIYHSGLYRVIREWYIEDEDDEFKNISNKDTLQAIFYYVNPNC